MPRSGMSVSSVDSCLVMQECGIELPHSFMMKEAVSLAQSRRRSQVNAGRGGRDT
jgi:hypothetical protein